MAKSVTRIFGPFARADKPKTARETVASTDAPAAAISEEPLSTEATVPSTLDATASSEARDADEPSPLTPAEVARARAAAAEEAAVQAQIAASQAREAAEFEAMEMAAKAREADEARRAEAARAAEAAAAAALAEFTAAEAARAAEDAAAAEAVRLEAAAATVRAAELAAEEALKQADAAAAEAAEAQARAVAEDEARATAETQETDAAAEAPAAAEETDAAAEVPAAADETDAAADTLAATAAGTPDAELESRAAAAQAAAAAHARAVGEVPADAPAVDVTAVVGPPLDATPSAASGDVAPAVAGDDVTTFIPTATPPSDITEFVAVPAATAGAAGLADDSWMRGTDDRRRERAEALVAEDGNAQSLSFSPAAHPAPSSLATLEGRNITAWFGDHQVLDRVSLTMPAGQVTALIGPSGCGKSTFLRILNRMHELIPSASLAGEVLLDGEDIYDASRKLVEARKHIGMVFQKPNPFPAMSIYDNVVAGLKLTGTRVSRSEKDALVESCLTKAGLWKEVKDRLRAPGAGLSGGQQQRLCIARSLAIKPRVLLMDEPCSALDPTSTRVIEETMLELVQDVTIVIVTHNMQQAQRVSQQCAFFLASQGTPGAIVEHGDTDAMFSDPIDPRTYDYVNGRFG